jgi:hypothetical protein
MEPTAGAESAKNASAAASASAENASEHQSTREHPHYSIYIHSAFVSAITNFDGFVSQNRFIDYEPISADRFALIGPDYISKEASIITF